MATITTEHPLATTMKTTAWTTILFYFWTILMQFPLELDDLLPALSRRQISAYTTYVIAKLKKRFTRF